MRAASLACAAATVLLTNVVDAASLEDWKSRSIYQVMIDRFARTDGSTTAECNELYLFCNGSWAGLMNNLDYIQDMGFTAIQISPVVKNEELDTAVGMPYHGYWSQDLYAVNENFGTADDLKSLSDELHNRGMYLMVDVVVNNMAQMFNNTLPPAVDYSQFNPFNEESYFHPYCNVTDWSNTTDYQDCWLYPYGIALADLDTEADEVVDMFSAWIKELVSNYSIDGLRIDAAKHVDNAFLPTFVDASGIFAFGEVLTGEPDDFCPYQTQGLLPGMPNYLEYYPLISVFNGGDMNDLQVMRGRAAGQCNDTTALGTFIENHDQPRFASYNDDMALAKNAMAYVILNNGIPTVYQGQEQHYKGAVVPDNREAIWLSGFNKTADLYVVAATLNKARNALIALTAESETTYVNSLPEALHVDTQHLCSSKGPMGRQIVSCIVNHGSTGSSYQLSVGGFNPNDPVIELLSCTTSVADGTGNVTMYMNKGEPKAYVLQSAIEGAGLCNTTEDAATAAADDDSAAGVVTLSVRTAAGMALAAVFALML